jgi:DNA mismatch repair protein MutS
MAGAAQIDLFAAPPAAPEPEAGPPCAPTAADAALAEIDPDSLSPREALAALYRLKALSKDHS